MTKKQKSSRKRCANRSANYSKAPAWKPNPTKADPLARTPVNHLAKRHDAAATRQAYGSSVRDDQRNARKQLTKKKRRATAKTAKENRQLNRELRA